MAAGTGESVGDGSFLKSLVALLAQHGGYTSVSVAEMREVGMDMSIVDLASDRAALTLRLGAKIYYVPAAGTTMGVVAKEEPCETTAPTESADAPASTGQESRLRSRIDSEISAINSLSNRPPSQPQPPTPTRSLPLSQTQVMPLGPPPRPDTPVGVYHQTDLSAFLREGEIAEGRDRYRSAHGAPAGSGSLPPEQSARAGVLPFKAHPARKPPTRKSPTRK